MKKILIGYFLLTCVLTWPLILYLNGFLVSNNFTDMDHSDISEHFIRLNESERSLSKNQDPFIVNWSEVSLTYVFSYLIFFFLDRVIFHNLFFFISIFLSGVFMCLFCYELLKDKIAAFLAGFFYISTPYLINEYLYVHSNLIQVQWIPLIFLYLEKTLRSNKTTDAVILGFSLFIQNVSCSQYTIYLSIILPIYLLFRFGLKKIFSKKIILALGIGLLLSVPYLIKRLGGTYTVRSIAEALQPGWSLVSSYDIFQPTASYYITPVFVILFLIGAYLIFSVSAFKKIISFPVLSFFNLIMMLGPVKPYFYYWFYLFWPFVNRFRVPTRFFPIMMLFSSVVASLIFIRMKHSGLKRYRIAIMILIMVLHLIFLFAFSPFFYARDIYFS